MIDQTANPHDRPVDQAVTERPQAHPASGPPPAAYDPAAHDPAAHDPTGIADLQPIIGRALDRAVAADHLTGPGCPSRLADAIRYALLAPGKRLRPALVYMAGQACGIDPHSQRAEALDAAAAAVEMIHAYSLIHDDLPAMDDDDLRRGRPTVHIRFDEATAILAGDALLTGAFVTLIQPPSGSSQATASCPSADVLVAAVAVLGRAAGATALVGGQSDDLQAERGAADRSEPVAGDATSALAMLERIHRRKTGALIAASLDLGALFSGANPTLRKILSDYADDLGLAFQVVDDLLDATSAADLGKRSGKDADRGKLTYPGLLGIDAAQAKAEQLVASAVGHARLLGEDGRRFISLARYVLERTH